MGQEAPSSLPQARGALRAQASRGAAPRRARRALGHSPWQRPRPPGGGRGSRGCCAAVPPGCLPSMVGGSRVFVHRRSPVSFCVRIAFRGRAGGGGLDTQDSRGVGGVACARLCPFWGFPLTLAKRRVGLASLPQEKNFKCPVREANNNCQDAWGTPEVPARAPSGSRAPAGSVGGVAGMGGMRQGPCARRAREGAASLLQPGSKIRKTGVP